MTLFKNKYIINFSHSINLLYSDANGKMLLYVGHSFIIYYYGNSDDLF